MIKKNKSSADLVKALESVSKMTKEEAKKELLKVVEKDLKAEIAKKIRFAEERIKLESKEKSKQILIDAMKHGATKYVAEYTVSSLKVTSEEVKGRVIGRGGANIRAFEQAAQVELEMGESNEIKISSFDSTRREIARRALEELIKDSRIQPTRIEEEVALQKKQMEDVLLEEGKKLAEECEVYNLPIDIIRLLGKFKFRTSYGQNLGIHTIEETRMGANIAAEIGADVEIVRLGCILHDIGKVVPEEDGNHVTVGVNLLKKHGFPKPVVNAVAEHHEDIPFSSLESVIVWVADAISGSRPGARYEPIEGFIKRMKKIEGIASSFDGVEKVYAFQSGRDVRVIVKPEEIDDDALVILAHDIAKRIEKEAEYAGQVKVTAIRELRVSATTAAK